MVSPWAVMLFARGWPGVKLLFFGTPAEAVPFLEECARDHEVLAVVTRQDKPSGRGLALTPPPVKVAAQKLGLAVLQPEQPGLVAAELKALGADLAVVVAYGRILKPDVLAAARLGFMNVHFSLLPKHRGAAPVAWSLLHGETRTGVTLFWLDEGMDTGPVQLARETPVGPDEDAVALLARLVPLGAAALRDALGEIAHGRARRDPQAGEPSLAPKLTREDARLSLARPAAEVHNRVRALTGGPRSFLPLAQGNVGVLKTAVESTEEQGQPGLVARIERGRGVLVQCAPGRLWLIAVQPEGKRQIPAADFINGLRLGPGGVLS